MNVIEAKQLIKHYQKRQAINATFSITENTITGLIGRNGAGKTTLLKLIAGHYRKITGSLTVFSEDPFTSLLVSNNLIFIDDHMLFPESLTLKDILSFSKTFYPNWNERLANGLIDYFRLPKHAHHQQLSKGMRSTFNSIIGIASRCSLTIMDEPTTGMDEGVRHDFYRALLKDYLQHPRTIIMSSHLLQEMEDLLEDILLIKNGEIILHRSVADLSTYCIGLTGERETVEKLIQYEDVLYKKSVGINSCYAVIVNRLTEKDVQEIRAKQINVSSVGVNDLCIYLTTNQQGGIDNVFEQL